jgi:hypothetical protein
MRNLIEANVRFGSWLREILAALGIDAPDPGIAD